MNNRYIFVFLLQLLLNKTSKSAELIERPNGYFITGRGCGASTKIKYLNYIPMNLENFECTFIQLKPSSPMNLYEEEIHGGFSVKISKGNILKHYLSWGYSYKVEADITFKKIPDQCCVNIFHFTTDKNHGKLGYRIPAIWITETSQIHITSGVNEHHNYWKNLKFELGKKYHLSIQQIQG